MKINHQKQVEKTHYNFLSYMDKGRWMSVWHQLNEVIKLEPEKVLEVGPGLGLFKNVASNFGIHVETIDLDRELNPDYVGSATSLPFDNASFDVTCAFQMLEHLPYSDSLKAFRELVRVSKKSVIISLPDAQSVFRYQVWIPKLAAFDRLIPVLRSKPKEHVFDGEHYWEINKIDYMLDRIICDFSKICRLEKTYRVVENPYHRFFVFGK
jgi:ubiquinone/menaquinone biosynthesis C-methylase UbiE